MSSLSYCPDAGSSSYWASKRRPPRAIDQALLPDAELWLASLPADARTLTLATRFPRIVNNIVARLRHPRELADYMDELLVDRRGNRSGFPVAVLTELIRLNSYFLKSRRYPMLAPSVDARPLGAIPGRERSIAPETLRRERTAVRTPYRATARPSLLGRLKAALSF